MLDMKYIYNIILRKIKQIIKVNVMFFFFIFFKLKIKIKSIIIDVMQLLNGNNLETIA